MNPIIALSAAVVLDTLILIALMVIVARLARRTRGNVDTDLVRSIAALTAADVAPKSLDMPAIVEKANVHAREAAHGLIEQRLAGWEAEERIREARLEEETRTLLRDKMAELRLTKIVPRGHRAPKL